MNISSTTLNWSRRATGQYAAVYGARRGSWDLTIRSPRSGPCVLTGARDDVAVHRSEHVNLRQAKEAALGLLSAAERIAWYADRTNPAQTRYTAFCGPYTFSATRNADDDENGPYTLTVAHEKSDGATVPGFHTLTAVKGYVARKLDDIFPPNTWTPLDDSPVCPCPHCPGHR